MPSHEDLEKLFAQKKTLLARWYGFQIMAEHYWLTFLTKIGVKS